VHVDDRDVAPVVLSVQRTVDWSKVHHAVAVRHEGLADELGQTTDLDPQKHVHG